MAILSELVEAFGLSQTDTARIINTAPARYFCFEIDKRNGGRRRIAQPAREVKAMQRYLLEEKLSKYPIHEAATAYKAGSSIADNVRPHLSSNPILKLDFKDFFPSIVPSDWERFARRHRITEIDARDIASYTKILFWGVLKNSTQPRCLSIGAPTSPALSNILMYDLDVKISSAAQKSKIVYTRYADDITISAKEISRLVDFELVVRQLVDKMQSPRLRFNEEKRGLFRKADRRVVTGLIITPDHKMSVGRDRKREVSVMLHYLSQDKLTDEKKALLKGLLAFCISVEVSFVERLRVKYGDRLVDQALKFHVPTKEMKQVAKSDEP